MVTDSITTCSTSGTKQASASSTLRCVAAPVLGQPQPPPSPASAEGRSRRMPVSSSKPTTSTGSRTESRARVIRVPTSSGCRSCRASRLDTSSSSSSAASGPSPVPRSAGVPRRPTIRARPSAVEVHQDPHQLLCRDAHFLVAGGAQTVEQVLDPLPGLHGVEGPRGCDDRRCGAHPASPLSPVGTCICWTVLPPPTYMWTPHGRQGSKLRTVRMMSMPLKFSGVFSSKIGVFCTASS